MQQTRSSSQAPTPLSFYSVLAAVEQKLAILNDVRESIEITQTGEYIKFLTIFFPALMHVLRSLPMSVTDDNKHKTRNTILEVLNRCACLPPCKPASHSCLDAILISSCCMPFGHTQAPCKLLCRY